MSIYTCYVCMKWIWCFDSWHIYVDWPYICTEQGSWRWNIYQTWWCKDQSL